MLTIIRQNRAIRFSAILLVIACLSLLNSCDNFLDPLQEKKGLYTIFGYLALRDTSFIRVKDLDDPLLEEPTRKIAAKVTLTNLATGRTEILQDSVIRFDSVYTHNFFTAMNINPETPYRVKVENRKGEYIAETITTLSLITDINKKVRMFIYRNSDNEIVDRDTLIYIRFYPVKLNSLVGYTLTQFGAISNGFCVPVKSGKTRIEPAHNKIPGFCKLRIEKFNPFLRRDTTRKDRTLTIPYSYIRLTNTLHLFYRHFGEGSFEAVTTIDSLLIPGGSGHLGSFYSDTLTFHFSPDEFINL